MGGVVLVNNKWHTKGPYATRANKAKKQAWLKWKSDAGGLMSEFER